MPDSREKKSRSNSQGQRPTRTYMLLRNGRKGEREREKGESEGEGRRIKF